MTPARDQLPQRLRRGSRVQAPRERSLRIAAAALAVAGIAVATYIAIAEAGGGSPVCLAGGHGCETVASSPYAHLAGANVAAIGIFGYVLLLGAALLPGDPARFAGLLLGIVGFGFSAYLTYLELFVIDAICQWCVVSAVLMTLLLLISATRALAYAASDSAAPGGLRTAYTNDEEDDSRHG